MPLRMSCTHGHAWDEPGPPGAVVSCPVCGVQIEVPRVAPFTDDSTVMIVSELASALHSPDLLPSFSDFVLQGELGRGGMGIVYKAIRISDSKPVAVKVIRKDRLQHDESVRRFRREAQAAARLNHPNIVRVFDSDYTGDTHYLVMEYVPGVTLERFVEHNGPLPQELACDFIRQAALALAHAQEQGLVHRDIKPSNLMVTPAAGRHPDGAPAQLKVLDMGVARVLRSEHHPGEALSTLTQGGSVIGTADFVAPEQLEDPHGADIRADLYSLGCTFYFLLVGQVPFPGGSLISKLDKQRWHMPAPITESRSNVAAAVAEVVWKLMAKKPADRYQTPTEVVAAFDELTRTNYLSSEPAGPTPRETRILSGHKGSTTCVALKADGQRAASAGKDQSVCLWNLDTGQLVRTFAKLPQEVRTVAFAPKDNHIAAAVGVSIRLWDAANGVELRRFSGHSAAVRCVAFASHGPWLISASDDKTIRVWDLQTGREAQRLARHTASVTCLAVGADGHLLLSGSRDQTIRRWDLRSGQEIATYRVDGGPIQAIALAPDGRRAASAHFDTILRIWNLEAGQLLGELHGHKQMVTGVGYLPDGASLLSSSQDGTVRWWDVNNGNERACLELHPSGINGLALGSTSRIAITAGNDGMIRLIEVP